jgi:uncharacterized membrane protein YraQ (UPF0718 family)
MNQATVILVIMAALMIALAARRRDGSLRNGLDLSWTTLKRTIPVMLVAFAIVGFVEELAPQEIVRTWIGPGSGIQGIFIGEVAGALLPGGPYVVFPLIAALYQAGAGIGPTLAMVTSWSGLALLSAAYELPFLGWRFTLIRMGLAWIVPLLVGLLGMAFFGG